MTYCRRSVGLGELGWRIDAAWAFAWRAVRASGRPAFRKSRAAGSVQLRNEVAQTLRTAKKLIPYRAWSEAPDDSVGFWDKGRESPTAGHSRTYQAFCFLGELSQIWGDLSQIFKPVTQPCQSKYSSCRSTRLGLCLRSSAQIRD